GGHHRRARQHRGCGDRRADRRAGAGAGRPYVAGGRAVQHLRRDGGRAGLPSQGIVPATAGTEDLMHATTVRTVLAGGLVVALLLAAGLAMPDWLLFLATMAISHGVVSLGVVVMMRAGVVSFGQGFVFAAGGYAAALVANQWGVGD